MGGLFCCAKMVAEMHKSFLVPHASVVRMNDFELICDTTRAGAKCTPREVREMVETYDPNLHTAPAIVGHFTDYPKDTRVPAGAWITELKASDDFTKLYAKFEHIGQVNVPVPKHFEELQEMAEWFPEVVNKKMYRKRSLAWVRNLGTSGKAYLHHVGFLGAIAPHVKGMPDIQQLSDDSISAKYFVELSEDAQLDIETMTISKIAEVKSALAGSTSKKPDAVRKLTAPVLLARIQELAESVTVDGATSGDPDAEAEINSLLEALREMYSLPGDASVGQILGAVQSEKAEQDAAKTAMIGAAVAGGYGVSPNMISSAVQMSEQKILNSLDKRFEDIGRKLTELADATPTPSAATATPPTDASTSTGAPAYQPVAMGLDSDKAQNAADNAVASLKGNNAWIPAFDDAGLPALMAAMANCKYNDASMLDELMKSLTSLPNITQLAEFNQELTEHEEQLKKIGGIATKAPKQEPIAGTEFVQLSEGQSVDSESVDIYKKTEAYARDHKISYAEADKILNG